MQWNTLINIVSLHSFSILTYNYYLQSLLYLVAFHTMIFRIPHLIFNINALYAHQNTLTLTVRSTLDIVDLFPARHTSARPLMPSVNYEYFE